MAKKRVVPQPENLEEAAHFVAKIGRAQHEVTRISTTLDRRVLRYQEAAATELAPFEAEIKDLVAGLFSFAQANRTEIVDDEEKKSVSLTTGTLSWRFTPPAVKLGSIEGVLESLDRLGLTQFIRTKYEVNREAMLQDTEKAKAVDGVTIGQVEEFIVKPTKTEVEIATRIPKKRTKKRKKG